MQQSMICLPSMGINVSKYIGVSMENTDWTSLSYEEKNKHLFQQQKETLDLFLERGAITQAQYDKSLHDLIEKMGMKSEEGTELRLS